MANHENMLTERQLQILTCVASLDYRGGVSRRVASVLGIKSSARSQFNEILYKLKVFDDTAAVCVALDRGIILPGALVGYANLESLFSGLSKAENGLLAAVFESTLEDCCASPDALAERLTVEVGTVQSHVSEIYRKLPFVHNPAQLGTAAYAYRMSQPQPALQLMA